MKRSFVDVSASKLSRRGDEEVFVKDFLVAAIHMVLWRRQVYPERTFQRTIRWGVSVWKSLHGGLSEYIEKHVRYAEEWFLKGKLSELAVLIFIPEQLVPVEKFRFKFVPSENEEEREVLTAAMCRTFFDKMFNKDFGPLRHNSKFSLLITCSDLDLNSYQDEWVVENPTDSHLRVGQNKRHGIKSLDAVMTLPCDGMEINSYFESQRT